VAKAVALGAQAVLVGRPVVWGLAVGGDKGVTAVLEILRAELTRTMQLMGRASVRELDLDCVGRL
jgi:isopentenyl diphosphate isomerase/L-lactate dehydrogenase-like FMN-dependent dehydrogenase